MSELGYECCICGKICTDWGNDPWPVVEDEDARCCDDCNNAKVIPVRLLMMHTKNRGEKINESICVQ